MPKTTLLLVRHGATAANLRQPHTLQGSLPDSPLAPAGLEQARACAASMRSYPIVKVYTSPLLRARATAEPIAAARGVPLEVEPGLLEIDVGQWAGLTWEEIDRRWPDEARAFHDDAGACGYLGGENLTQLRDRVLPVIVRLIERHAGETIVAVSHGVVNRALMAHWIGLPLRFARRLPQDNAAYNLIEFERGKVKVRTVNVAIHLPRAA